MRRLQDRCLPELRRRFLGDHDVQRNVHQGDGGSALAVGDDESRAGVLGAPRQLSGLHALGARYGHQPGLQRSEQDRDPRRGLRREDEQAVSRLEPPVAQQRSPTVRFPRDLREGAPVDDPVAVDVRQRGIQRIGRVGLDDIARVVEPRRNLPDAFERWSLVYALAEELSHVSRQPSLPPGRCRNPCCRRPGVATSGGVEGDGLNNHLAAGTLWSRTWRKLQGQFAHYLRCSRRHVAGEGRKRACFPGASGMRTGGRKRSLEAQEYPIGGVASPEWGVCARCPDAR